MTLLAPVTLAAPPTVATSDPPGGATGVDIVAPITIIFDSTMDQATTEAAVSVADGAGTVAGTATLQADQVTLTFTPASNLACATTCTVTVAGTAKHFSTADTLDGNGNGASEGSPADDHVFTFTTRPWLGYAVLVGVSDYPGVADDLPAPVADVEAVRATLLSDAEHWADVNVAVLADAEADGNTVLSVIDARFGLAEPEDVCLFYFSGHGTAVPDESPFDEGGGDGLDEAILPHDFATGGYILDDDLATRLQPHSAKRICVILDTCRAGGMAKLASGTPPEPWTDGFAADLLTTEARSPRRKPQNGNRRCTPMHADEGSTTRRGRSPYRRESACIGGSKCRSPCSPCLRGGIQRCSAIPDGHVATPKDISAAPAQTGIVMLMGSTETGYAYEDPVLRHAVLTFYVIEALRRESADGDGDGFVSAEEAFEYAAPRVTEWEPRQTPVIYDSVSAADPDEDLPLIAAADRPLDRVVTLDDFPFGDTGCRPGGRASSGGGPFAVTLGVALVLAVSACVRARSESNRR